MRPVPAVITEQIECLLRQIGRTFAGPHSPVGQLRRGRVQPAGSGDAAGLKPVRRRHLGGEAEIGDAKPRRCRLATE